MGLLIKALRLEFRECVDLFIGTIPNQRVDRFKILQDIANGKIVILDQNQYDLINAGIMNLSKEYEDGRMEYQGIVRIVQVVTKALRVGQSWPRCGVIVTT